MLVFDNVTEEVKARTALQNLNRELDGLVRARTSQLEEANALLLSYASFVSHDLHSPLTVMKGYLSMLKEGVYPVGAEAAEPIDQAYQAAVAMDDLLHNILQLAHDVHVGGRVAPATAVDPQPIIARVHQHLGQQYPNAARQIVQSALPLVGVSAVVIERVFYNLLGNALKYSAAAAAPLIEIGSLAAKPGEAPVIFVRDNGVGFDARQADKLFAEFSRLETAASADGLGLGLSLVARLVRLHGGRIWAEGQTGMGATFYVQLPAGSAPAAQLGPN
jgi:signal transduction histidine kinase